MMAAHNVISRGGIVVMTKCPSVSIQGLAQIRKIQPNIPMVNIFEDIDTIIENYGESDLLSLLDGENQIDNIVSIATTNYPEKLDHRFKNRPSRFDEIYKVDMPNEAVRRNYLVSITEGKIDADVVDNNIDKWVDDTKDFSLAHLREMIVGVYCLDGEYDTVLKRLRAMMHSKLSAKAKGGDVGFVVD
jgi:SpoVK/Ycf46/Vps4 family AAA+-type ATPase